MLDHERVEIAPPGTAARERAPEPIFVEGSALDLVAPNEPLQLSSRRIAASPILAVSTAHLSPLGRIYAFEPDLDIAQMKAIAINQTGATGERRGEPLFNPVRHKHGDEECRQHKPAPTSSHRATRPALHRLLSSLCGALSKRNIS